MKIYNIFFSPKGTTEKVANKICSGISKDVERVNLLTSPLNSKLCIAKEDCLVVAMPVYSGRIPAIAVPWLENLQGDNTPAIILGVYGNREYEDALVEMQDILEAKGFIAVAAGAFVAEHSIFTQVAKGRPDASDEAIMLDFAAKCKDLFCDGAIKEAHSLHIKGNRPYREVSGVPLKPVGNKKCTDCKTCEKLCPTKAIGENPRKTDKEKCISCGACIKACPQKARGYSGMLYKVAGKSFAEKCATPKKPELFF